MALYGTKSPGKRTGPLSIPLFVFFFFFQLCLVACKILVPLSGIEPMPSAVEMKILSHWISREVPPALSHFSSFWDLQTKSSLK